jgi:hypothetical protein
MAMAWADWNPRSGTTKEAALRSMIELAASEFFA